MLTSKCILHPFGDILGMIADAFIVFGDHQQINRLGAGGCVGTDMLDQFVLYDIKQIVDGVIQAHHPAGKLQILVDIGVQAALDHCNGVFAHLGQMHKLLDVGFVCNVNHDAGNIRRLIADALHIRNHFKRCGDQAQVLCHGLLL